MGTFAGRVVALAAWTVFALRPAAFCQLEDLVEEDAGKAKTVTRLAVGTANATPGASVALPAYLTLAEGVEVGRFKLEVNFVSANLKFVRLDRGIAAELGGLDLSSELKTEKNDKGVETSTLTVLASSPSAEPEKRAIPEGLFAYLLFRVEEEGRPASITLRVKGEATDLKTNQPVQNLQVADGKVDVFAPGDLPTVSCFFFTH